MLLEENILCCKLLCQKGFNHIEREIFIYNLLVRVHLVIEMS
jgi:hypothetical protein